MPFFNTRWIGNGQTVTYQTPPTPSGPNLLFTATDPAHPGNVVLGGPPGSTHGAGSPVWTFQSVEALGFGGHNYGTVNFGHPYAGTVNLLHRMNLSNSSVTLNTYDGGSYTLNGNSSVDNHSTLTALGGRYAVTLGGNFGDTFRVNGSMYVTNHSVANFDNAKLAGTGTIHVGSSSIVDARTIVAGLHMDVDKGGALSLLYPNSAGTINLARGGAVYVAGAATAAKEIFHEASGTLDLLDKSGVQVASLKFAPGSHEYTSAASFHGGLLEITTNQMMAGNLHASFVS